MKHLIALVVCVAFLGAAAFVQAKPSDTAQGTHGTVASMGSSGFTMTVKDKTIKVQCNSMTKFMDDGKQVPANSIKEGVDVAVQGGVSGVDTMMATTVTIVHGHKKK